MFTTPDTSKKETVEGRAHAFHSMPGFTPTDDLIFVHATIPPGGGHAFHNHPNKEEVIYILEGEAEQWLEQEKRTLGPGSSVYIPKSAVHATFNRTDKDLKFIAVITPCSSEGPGRSSRSVEKYSRGYVEMECPCQAIPRLDVPSSNPYSCL